METPMSDIYALKGGFKNQSLIHFAVCKKTNLVRILHFAEYDKSRLAYAEQCFIMMIDGNDTRIESKMHYSIEFARTVWTTFTNLPEKKTPTYIFTKYPPFTIPSDVKNPISHSSPTYAMEA
jgi:hypothetical protein